MTNQHGTGILQVQNYDEYRFLLLTKEGPHTHYFGVTTKGRRRPLELPQARQARRNGVGIDLPDTALLAQRDGE